MSATIRTKLPNRRPSVTRRIVFMAPGGQGRTQKLHVTTSYIVASDCFPRVLEVFLRGGSKVGSELDNLLDDAAVMLSTLLQCGLTPAELREHLGADDRGRPLSIVAAAADELIRVQADLVAAWESMPPAQRSAFPLHYREPDPELEDAA